ncbi:Uncharacterized protein TCM_036482 [Theobroma cacao]|uniref:Uncharacterized protein n=1 Tax=Theobroma cacao TaxID=3641 RepID=A0A061FS19_THECC|nr:Uncharacterized protein TCM_036482 [Theobroma cacao]
MEKWRLDYATILVEVRSLQDIFPFMPIEANGKGFLVRDSIKEVLSCEAISRCNETPSDTSDEGDRGLDKSNLGVEGAIESTKGRAKDVQLRGKEVVCTKKNGNGQNMMERKNDGRYCSATAQISSDDDEDADEGSVDINKENELIFEMSNLMGLEFVKGIEEVLCYVTGMKEGMTEKAHSK